jgi:CRISPR-associated endoribonuclease Cas6
MAGMILGLSNNELIEPVVSTQMLVPLSPLGFLLEGKLPIFPYALTWWHGALGRVLHHHFPEVFELLYGESNDQARLYALTPPTPQNPHLKITLFGPAVEHSVAVSQALLLLGAEEEYPFQVRRAEVETCLGNHIFYTAELGLTDWPKALPLTSWLEQKQMVSKVTIQLLTPLILKEGNEVLQDAPEFSQFIQRLLSRISQVSFSAGCAAPFSKSQIIEWIELARPVELVKAVLYNTQLERQSGRTKQRMFFSGFTGKLEYAGDITPFVGLLRLGEKFQLGGKTAFGFGAYGFEFTVQEGLWH